MRTAGVGLSLAAHCAAAAPALSAMRLPAIDFSPMRQVPRGIYAITSDAVLDAPGELPARIDAVLRGGAALLQFRAKRLAPGERLPLALAVRERCSAHGVPLIINDDLELAEACAADGVHLGLSDSSPEQARARLGASALIGLSCNNSAERARRALQQGVDYIALGRFFASVTKPDAPAADLALLQQVHRECPLPICVIGGIKAGHIRELAEGGAQLFAVVDAIFGQHDAEAATRELVEAVQHAQAAAVAARR